MQGEAHMEHDTVTQKPGKSWSGDDSLLLLGHTCCAQESVFLIFRLH